MRRHSKNLGCGALARVANQHMLTSCEASVVALRAEPKRSTPQSPGKAFWRLGSGTQEEQRGSRGRIRHERVGHGGIWAESHLTEPTGIDYAVANFIPLPITHVYPLPEAPKRPFTGSPATSYH